ncbi:MAG: hypothetical protein ACTSQS_11690, partial [Promethearchaeota archaeon]
MNLALLTFVFALFIIILISYAIKDFDFVAISLFCSFIAAMTTGVILGLNFNDFIGYIEFQVIIIILSMSIITKIARDSQILEFLAIKLFKLAKGDERVFFYLICIIATL